MHKQFFHIQSEWGIVKPPSLYPYIEQFDVPVDKSGFCIGYPCPLALKIDSSDFKYPRFSGYYISNFPGTYDSKKVFYSYLLLGGILKLR